jgi:hypothetical protein
MKYLEKLLEKSAPKRVNVGDPKDEYVSAGKTGQTTVPKRLMKGDSKKASSSADVRVSNYTAGPKGKLPDHTEYKRIGALMAEALGYRIDELAPLLAAPLAVAGKAAGVAAKGVGMAAKGAAKAAGGAAKAGAKAAGGAAKQAGKQAASGFADKVKEKAVDKVGGMEESLIYPYYMLALHLAEAADEGFVKSPLAKRAAAASGAKRVGDINKSTKMTPDVKKIAREGNKKVSDKLGVKTNVKTDAALQIGQRARRQANRKAGVGMPPESRDIAKADAALDKKKMAGPEG